MLKTLYHQPAERMDYDLDYQALLGSEDNLESVAASVAVLNQGVAGSAPLTVTVAILPGGRYVKLWLLAGAGEGSYKLTVTATTALGRVKQVELKIRVKDE